MRQIISILCFFLAFAPTIFSQTPKIPSDLSIKLQYKSEKAKKAPLRTYYIDIEVKNTQDEPVWYIFPNFGENTLPENGIFEAEQPWRRNYISGCTYYDSLNRREDGKPKRFVKVHFIGKKSGFYAFRLPPNASASFRAYPIDAWQAIADIEVWEASDLLINNEIKLEDFLLYETLCSDGVEIQDVQRAFYNIDWKKGDLVSAVSQTEVKSIKAVPISKKRYEIEK